MTTMQNINSKNNYMPRICFMSHHLLRTFSKPIIEEYAFRAQIETIDASFEQVLSLANERISAANVDVFLSAGSNASILRDGIQTPVVSIDVSGYDLMKALIKAKEISPNVGVITYGDAIPSLDDLKSLLLLNLTQYHYKTPREAQACIQKLKDKGVEVVLGSSIIVELAQKAAMKAILTYSLESIRIALDQALEVGRVAHLEQTRFEQLNSVLQTLPEAVVAVNSQEKIIAINHAMKKILSVESHDLRGRTLSEVQPELSLKDVLQHHTEDEIPSSVLQLDNRDWVSHKAAIFENGQIVGAAITLHDAGTIYTADTKLRMFERKRQFTARHHFGTIQGDSVALKNTINKAKRYSKSEFDILIMGESGTGKELFAQAIHNESHRANQPFIAINCAAFPETLIESELFGHDDGAFTGSKRGGRRGLIESAHKGTLFLDEIGDMPLSLQTRLLRVLQERAITRLGSNTPIPIDIRVIAATHQPLKDLVALKQFRQDLYYRLNTLELRLPPLRERKNDITLLFNTFLKSNLTKNFKNHAVLDEIQHLLSSILNQYLWPGNIRELESVAKRVAILLPTLATPIDQNLLYEELPDIFTKHSISDDADQTLPANILHPHTSPKAPFENLKTQFDKATAALKMANGNHLQAATLLGISRTTLWRWLNK